MSTNNMIDVRSHSSQRAARRHRPPDVIRPVPTRIIKPIAVKATTIHPRMVQEFEQACHEEKLQLPPAVIHAAVQESQEWHRKWTLQDEEAHNTTSLDDSWRTEGAKNPSLSNSDNESGGEQEEELATFRISSPALRPVVRQAFVPSPLLLPDVSPGECDEEDEPALLPISRTSSRASSRASSPLTLPSGQSSVHSGWSGLTRDDESMISFPIVPTMETYKEAMFHALAIHGGESTTEAFQAALEPLAKHYDELGWDARFEQSNTERVLEGMWLTLSKASFFGSLGENPNGDPLYTLGRMAFDMFLPTQLVCSLQGNFNPVRIVPPEMRPTTEAEIPKNLLEEVEMGTHTLRTYNIITAFTIEPHMADYPSAPNRDVRRPIKGIMTTYGYVLPDPQVPNRLSIWFTGGQIRPNNDEYDEREWKRLFGNHHHPGRTLSEKTRVFAANLLMGAQVPQEMQDDGTLSYTFTRPLGGHGVAYVDVLYLDSTLRIVRGHKGTFFVFTRIPDDGSIS